MSQQCWQKGYRVAIPTGRFLRQKGKAFNEQMNEIEKDGTYSSDDPHVLALARVSGARLLYTKDQKLQRDFKNSALINRPRGKVYPTLENENSKKVRKRMLADRTLCRSEQ